MESTENNPKLATSGVLIANPLSYVIDSRDYCYYDISLKKNREVKSSKLKQKIQDQILPLRNQCPSWLAGVSKTGRIQCAETEALH